VGHTWAIAMQTTRAQSVLHQAPAAEAVADRPATVALVTLGCARNEVDSEELAARLEIGGFQLVDDPTQASAVLVNTCGFVESAKKDSIDTLLAASDLKQGADRSRVVVALGCLAERYGTQLAESLPEVDAVLGFDDYPDLGDRLGDILTGVRRPAHTPRDRRRLLPLSPAARGQIDLEVPGHAFSEPDLPIGLAPASGPRPIRRRLDCGPVAPLKLASGCDRRCAFCAIPSFRGAFISRPPADLLSEAGWLARQGVRELFLVSENSTSYGKDLGDLRLLEALLPELAAIDGIDRVRISYLQPAELRLGLIDVLSGTPGVAPYFDLSFQHASGSLLRSMRRFGDGESFLHLLDQIRDRSPDAGIRSNVIVGFPGESESDVATLADFLEAARLDAIGVFGYSDEDGTEAFGYDNKLDRAEIDARVEHISRLAEELTSQRAEDRIGQRVTLLVESVANDAATGAVEGRAEHQGPDVDGTTTLADCDEVDAVGTLVTSEVVGSSGVDLLARPVTS
jgi:ribosomal protein S12 methylthiotransferase